MSQGDKIGMLLAEGERNHTQMRQIFLDHNVPYLYLELLPPEAKEEWDQLREKNEAITRQMADVLNIKRNN